MPEAHGRGSSAPRRPRPFPRDTDTTSVPGRRPRPGGEAAARLDISTAALDRTAGGLDAPTPVRSGAGLLARVRSMSRFQQIAAISASLVGTSAVTSVLGLLYWAIAARQSSVADVGIAGASVALMLLLGSFGMLGLGTLMMAEVPNIAQGERRLFVRTSLFTAGIASTAIGAVAALVVGMLGGTSLTVLGMPLNVLDFAIGTGLTGLTMVLDQAVLVIGASRVQLERNTVASIAKIVVLIGLGMLGHTSGMDIFLSWTVGNLVSLTVVLVRTKGGRALQASRRLVDLGLVRRMARSAASHHLLNIMLQAPILLLSIVVAIALTAEDNGYFSTARSIAGFVFVLPFSITIALFASARGRESELAKRMRFTIPFGLAASLLADIVLFPLGSTVLGVFGGEYSDKALTTLQVLVLAGLPFVIKDHFVALRRVQNRTANAALIALGGAVFELIAAYVGAKVGGTVGLCAFWVGALSIEAILLTPTLLRAMRAGNGDAGDEIATPPVPARHARTGATPRSADGPFVRGRELVPMTGAGNGADR